MSGGIRWLFFDVGNTLLHDDFAMLFIYDLIFRKVQGVDPSVKFADLMAMRERLIVEEHDTQPHWTIGRRYFGEEGWKDLRELYMSEFDRNYARYHRPAPHAEEVLAELAGRYRLGVAANQVPNCRTALEQFGVSRYLQLVWISEEVGLEKPAPEFFRRLLQEAGCPPGSTVMIGDRVDYDVYPAKQLGMKTVQTQLRFELPPASDEQTRIFFESLGRARIAQVPPSVPEEKPDAVVTSLRELPELIERL